MNQQKSVFESIALEESHEIREEGQVELHWVV